MDCFHTEKFVEIVRSKKHGYQAILKLLVMAKALAFFFSLFYFCQSEMIKELKTIADINTRNTDIKTRILFENV